MPGLLKLSQLGLPLAEVLDEQLDDVGLILERQLASDLSAVNTLCRHLEHYHGKRLRPTLVLLTGLATGGPPWDGSTLGEKHRIVAAVVEMIHLATLVHDDVLDEAQLRRQAATLNHLRGNETAVMLGDYLISNAFHLCSSMMDPRVNLSLGEVTNALCEGELLELHHRDDHAIDEETYLEIVRCKTASLIGECCRLGALLSGADETVCDALRRLGIRLGIAFQIQDDILDITGDASVVGKSLGRDLDSGKVILPLIRYLARADKDQQGLALRQFVQRNAEPLQRRLAESGALTEAQDLAVSLVEEAKSELECLAPSPARDLLGALADAVVTRRY
jgi:octaprenyl-diphosphate synthase